MASTKPRPRMLRLARKAMTLLPGRTRSCSPGNSDRSWISEPPGCSMKFCPSNLPARRSTTWLEPPMIGVAWHSPQPAALNTGPRPSDGPSGPVNSSSAASKRAAIDRAVGEEVEARRRLGGRRQRRERGRRFACHLRWLQRLPALRDHDRRREQTSLRDDRARQDRSGSHTHLASIRLRVTQRPDTRPADRRVAIEFRRLLGRLERERRACSASLERANTTPARSRRQAEP